MNKRYLFILIPLLALLFSFNSKAGDPIHLNKSLFPGFNFSGFKLQQGKLAAHTNLQRDYPRQVKNKVRIKAWDDSFELEVPAAQVNHLIFRYYPERSFQLYSFSFRQAYPSTNSLRGPPIAE
jgi:hypothetical protein